MTSSVNQLRPPVQHEVSGVIHCHSTYSDGMEPMPVVIAAANRAGLDFLLMTDHNTLAPARELGDTWSSSTLVLQGCEITPQRNHFLTYGLREQVSEKLPPAQFTAEVARQGAIGFIAHPFELGSRLLGQDRYIWEDWSVTDYTGIEVWNFFSQWVGSSRTIFSALRSVFDWRFAVRAPYPETLARWDQLGQRRRVTGIGGMDAHGIKFRALGVEIVLHPYERSFRQVRTHLLLPGPFRREVAHDRALVVAALRDGSCYFAHHGEGDPSGFRFYGWRGRHWLTMGQEAPSRQPGEVLLIASAPRPRQGRAEIRLLKDGAVIKAVQGTEIQVEDQGPGVYRVEVWVGHRGWIFSNPIYLRAEG